MQRKYICSQNDSSKTSFRWGLCSKPWSSHTKTCLLSLTSRNLNILVHLYLTSSVWLHLLGFTLTFTSNHNGILCTSCSICLEGSSPTSLLQVFMETHPHDETVSGHAGQNFSPLSRTSICSFLAFFILSIFQHRIYFIYIWCMYCLHPSPKYNLQKVFLYVLSILYTLEVLLNVRCNEPKSKYFGLCGPYALCSNYSILPLRCKNSYGQWMSMTIF